MLKRIEIKYGLIFSLFSFVWLILEYAFGLHGSYIKYYPMANNLFIVPATYIMVRAIVAKKTELGGAITFSLAFQTGFFITLIVAILSPGLSYIFHSWINPGFFASAREAAVKFFNTSAEQAEAEYNLKSFMVQSAIGAIVMGTISSLIIALAIRSRK